MKRKILKNNLSFFLGVVAFLFVGVSAVCITTIPANEVMFSSNKTVETNVKGALDELFDRASRFCPNGLTCYKIHGTGITNDVSGSGCILGDNDSSGIYGPITPKQNTLLSVLANSTSGTDKDIDFLNVPSETNGLGVLTRNGTENDEYPIYYYRGDIDNNNVIFGGYCWKMVRSTVTGGVRLIYNGKAESKYDYQSLKKESYKIISNIGQFTYDDSTNKWTLIYTDSKMTPELSFKVPMGEFYQLHVQVSTTGNKTSLEGSGRVFIDEYQQGNFEFNDNNTIDYIYKADAFYDNTIKVDFSSIDASEKNPIVITIEMIDKDDVKLPQLLYTVRTNKGDFTFDSNDNTWNITITDDSTKELSFILPGGDYYRFAINGTTGDNSGGVYTVYKNNNILEINSIGGNYPIRVASDLGYTTSKNIIKFTFSGGASPTNPVILKLRIVQSNAPIEKNCNHSNPNNNDIVSIPLYVSNNPDSDGNYRYSTVYKAGYGLSQITKYQYNTRTSDEELLGYNYSNIKKALDAWYEGNIKETPSERYIEDSIYCNDRSKHVDEGSYCTYQRMIEGKPTTLCTRGEDAYGVSNGNQQLDYPIGFLTQDELMLAGRTYDISYNDYLNNGSSYWLASPSSYGSVNNISNGYIVNNGYNLYEGIDNIASSNGIRPVISLKENTKYIKGDGTKDNPYIIN